ncbi:PRC-barrel domain-containing protein [Tardiphaga sp. OK245]|jgi:sporulation protein YlmC with PRC-barrel domain|uniref:PRC-barrel domain-containing protein n=1 Tax=Tardiphaga sp. OK245 TaxID=1855306 RepID=UPI0008A7D345|nr:PRC-barrel domain-containing protein [Tardiphaga sp. OK245]SEI19928.1 PRC-barrel domain-containing protein [Tardiphaga sp. OK245]
MFKKYMTAGIVGSALLATAAFAQSPSATTTTTAPAAAPVTASDTTFNGNWRTSKVVGLSVYNEANESLGSINDLLTDKQGNIKAVVIGVGGFLGVGERLIAVPYDKIKFVNEPVATMASSTGGSSGMKSTSPPSGMTTGAATTGAAPAAAAPAKANPWYPDHAVLSGASKDQLKAMPEFKYAM